MTEELKPLDGGKLQILPVMERIAAARRIFNPHQPIADRNLFSGRVPQLDQALTALRTPGKHPIVFGVRGVGKTSLANIIKLIAPIDNMVVVSHQCSGGSTFSNIITSAFSKINLNRQTNAIGFGASTNSHTVPLDSLLPPSFNQEGVVELVKGTGARILLIVDEFDRVKANERAKMSDLVKAASDIGEDKLKILLVGVGETLDDLIRDHPSIERNISEIHMNLMSRDEIAGIIYKGAQELKIVFNNSVVERIIECAQGFPYFTHLLAQNASICAIRADAIEVNEEHFASGLKSAIGEVDQSIRNSYGNSIQSNRPTQFADVLYAAALAEADEFGRFSAKDLTVMAKVDGSYFSLQSVQYPLSKLSNPERGQILIKEGQTKRFRYRFSNPMMKQYIIMRRMASAEPA